MVGLNILSLLSDHAIEIIVGVFGFLAIYWRGRSKSADARANDLENQRKAEVKDIQQLKEVRDEIASQDADSLFAYLRDNWLRKPKPTDTNRRR